MNKIIPTIAGIILVLLLLGGGFFMIRGSNTKTPVMEKTVSPTATKMTTEKKSLSDLMALTGNQKCTFADSQASSSGTVYSGSGNMRGDFQAQGSGKTIQTHMVSDGKYVYVWMEGETKGYKMSLDVLKKMSDSVPQQYKSQAVDIKKQIDYTCNPWTIDGTKFVVPTNITFTDYTSMMQGLTGKASASPSTTEIQGNQAACSQCGQLPTSAQAQCRTALHC